VFFRPRGAIAPQAQHPDEGQSEPKDAPREAETLALARMCESRNRQDARRGSERNGFCPSGDRQRHTDNTVAHGKDEDSVNEEVEDSPCSAVKYSAAIQGSKTRA